MFVLEESKERHTGPLSLRMLDIIWTSLLIFGLCCLSTFEHKADNSRSQDYQSDINGEKQALLDDEQRTNSLKEDNEQLSNQE